MTEITLFQATAPAYHLKSTIYDPDFPSTSGRTVPRVGALVFDDVDTHSALYSVKAVDGTTFKVTYSEIIIPQAAGDDTSLTSTVSYGNDIFRAFYDPRTTPTRLAVDRRLMILGSDNATYRLLRNAGTASQEVVSRYYDADGVFVDTKVPMSRVAPGVNNWFCVDCNTLAELTDGEKLTLQIYNEYGALLAEAVLFAKASTIVNEATMRKPVITSLEVRGAQRAALNDFYLYETQNAGSLTLQAVLHFDDGTEREAAIDRQKTFVFGLDDIVTAYAGMQQEFIVRYYLGRDEEVDPGLTDKRWIDQIATVTVVPNELAASMKVSVIPVWNAGLAAYSLRYYYYTTDRNVVRDITAFVTIDEGNFVGNRYGVAQTFTLAVNMALVDPVAYNQAAAYRQMVTIRLQPMAALERYTLADSPSALTVFGVDASSSRRPVLYYDSALQQLYIPTSTFVNQESIVESFYRKASPPYLADTETGPVAPTHFLLRDPYTGTMVTAAQIPLADYAAAFNVIGGAPGRFVGSTVIVEFVRQISVSQSLILYGVPVDVWPSPSGYVG